jgi:peptidoglycan/LPS O-acetylase OafA/YrhL
LSYPVSLWHFALLRLYGLPGLLPLLPIAAASYLLVERPAMRWARRGFSWRAPMPVPA